MLRPRFTTAASAISSPVEAGRMKRSDSSTLAQQSPSWPG